MIETLQILTHLHSLRPNTLTNTNPLHCLLSFECTQKNDVLLNKYSKLSKALYINEKRRKRTYNLMYIHAI